ncbi:MAG TPA: metal-dependent hydrolase [Aggregatilinea sp.]|uniref:metal-dependent hydrolase n=1 Tax=Aggregatilinea sp. TaxID=2806333 RepID=UPI002C0ADEB5|nr:metal-dependent hydrolase [Aggregatilinea sp.]HML24669.1 metal-dependent hydrolase [Aggregatilinea sp.]
MLAAHLVPGYLAASSVKPSPGWSIAQRRLLWSVALTSTVAPDADVVYNALFRGFVNHSTLWTHSLFVYVGIGLVWWLLRRADVQPYGRALIGLIAVGGLSHLALDAIAHNTPLLYPLSTHMFGIAPAQVAEGTIKDYVTDPVFVLEPLLLLFAFVHWRRTRKRSFTYSTGN